MVATKSTSFIATLAPDGNLLIPDEAKELLKLDGVKQVSIVFDQHGVHFFPLKMTIDEVKGSVPGVTGVSEDFGEEIKAAVDEAMAKKYGLHNRMGGADDPNDGNGG